MGACAVHQQAPDVAVAALGDAPSRSLPPLDRCCGTRPSHAANWRAERNSLALPTLATTAVAVIRPTPGISASRRLAAQEVCQARSFFSIEAISPWIDRICEVKH